MWRWLDKVRFSHIGGRIFAGFGLVLGIFMAQALITHLGFDETVNNFHSFRHLNAEAEAILAIERDALDLQRSVLAFSYTGYEGILSRIHRLQGELRERTVKVLDSTQDAARQDRLKRMMAHFETYARDFETAVEDRRLHDQLLEQKENVLAGGLERGLSELLDRALAEGDADTAAVLGPALRDLLQARQDILLFINTPDSSWVRAAHEHLGAFSASLDRLRSGPASPAFRDGLERLAPEVPEYEQSVLGLVQATRGYLHMVNVVLPGEAAEIAHLTAELKQLTLDQQSLLVRQMDHHIAASQNLSRSVSLLAILAGLVSAWAISRSISRPIAAMTEALTELARGRRDIQIPGRGRKDEIGAMAIAADVFKGKADELENASRYKSEFLANMSHELRTPLNSLLVLAKIFAANEEGNLSEEQVESAKVIHGSGNDLLHLINDVLDLSKIEAGRMEVVADRQEVAGFARSIERQFRHVAANKGLEFTVEVDAAADRAVCSDWGKIEQIVRNLLSNAFKFTGQGGVRVHIGPASRDAVYMDRELRRYNLLEISVADTGIGIPEDKREQIFEAFRQVDGTTSRKYGGTGLGLSISRNFARLIGGELQVASQPGRGSAFTLYIPTDRYTETEASAPHALDGKPIPGPSVSWPVRPVDVLMADDDPRNLFAIGKILRPKVRNLYTARDGLEALASLEQHPDTEIVLMDIMMPNLDGYETMRAIRAQPRFLGLPIIALTARAMHGDREKCLEAGASDYLSKPVNPDELLRVMGSWLARTLLSDTPDLPPEISSAPQAQAAPTTAAPSHPLLKDGQAAKLLIADRDMRDLFSLARALQPHTGPIVLAADIDKVLAWAEQRGDFDAMLLGDGLPGLDLAAAVPEIRRRAARPGLPIVVLDSGLDAEQRRRCLDAGASACLAKPATLETLLPTLSNLLGAGPATGGGDD